MHRVVNPELLDTLDPSDPEAIQSRADLRRVNVLMNQTRHLLRALRLYHQPADRPSRPLRLVEIGAGDGTLLLNLARRWHLQEGPIEATLLDRHNLMTVETQCAFRSLHWVATPLAIDVLDWLKSPAPGATVILANLFLHHFSNERLTQLLKLVARKTELFVACEPRRSNFALGAARCLSLIGCNRITRHDAAVSVQAGFTGQEITALWPSAAGWTCRENRAGLFSHSFVAYRHG